jgi:tetrahydromethanopterin S-methyltransferase subunit B
MTDEDLKKIEKAGREAAKFSESLKSVDFEIQQFNQFVHRVKTIKTKGIFLGIFFGMLAGCFITVFATKGIMELYLNSKTENFQKAFYEALPFQYFLDEKTGIVQLWASKNESTIFTTTDGLNVIEIKNKK